MEETKLEKLIKKIDRKNHLDHLVAVVPLIVFAYGIQCWLIASFFPEQKLSHFAMPLALSLVFMMAGLIVYDTYSSFEMYETFFEVKFSPFGQSKKFHYAQIMSVEVLEPEANFSNIIFTLPDNKFKMVYFIDDAVAIKQIIEDYHKSQIAKHSQNLAA